MQQRRLLVPALFVFLASMLFCTIAPGLASGATIAQKKAQAAQIAAQVSALNTKMEFAVEAYDAATQKLATVQGQIHRNEQQLSIARYNLLVARQLLTQRVVSMYKQNKASVLDVLLSTRSFDNLVTEVNAMRQVGQSDSATVSTIEALKKQISQRRVALLAEGRQAKTLVAQRAVDQAADLLRPAEPARPCCKRRPEADRQHAGGSGGSGQGRRRESGSRGKAAARRPRRRSSRVVAAAVAARPPRPAPTARSLASPSSTSASPTCGAAPAQSASTARAWPCTCYAQVGISLPHNAAMQYASITHVAHGSEQPGDLVFFGYSAGGIHHVGIYVGGGSMIDAPYTGVDVRYDSAFSGDYFASGRP